MMLLKLFGLNRPLTSLLAIFIAWKTVLLLLSVCSPGPGYDTSTSLLFAAENGTHFSYVRDLVSEKLTRWDAIYFTKVAQRGYLWEQEWAFGWGWTGLISQVTSGLSEVGIGQDNVLQMGSLVGIFIAHLSHLLSVLILYKLTNSVFAGSTGKKLAFISACLHIFSPAGLFLSAPYTESTFALLSFTGYYLFIHSLGNEIGEDAKLVLAGALFGFSVTIRSNGLLNGILFLEEAIRALLSLKIRRLLAAWLGGAFVGVGFILPQIIAYKHFCTNNEQMGTAREWCTGMVPSIYRFVQLHYWNCGFLRYWTLSNIPLFLLATPMFTILALSSIWGIDIMNFQFSSPETGARKKAQSTRNTPQSFSSNHVARVVRTMAVIQAILSITTLLEAHVQIITRMASAYPVWHWWLASKIADTGSSSGGQPQNNKGSEWAVRWMIMYAVVQGGLFASFLPPA